MMNELCPFDPEDPKFLNPGIWEFPSSLPNRRKLTVKVRVSTDKHEQNSSVPNQLEAARQYANEHGVPIVRIVVVRASGLKVHRNAVHKEFLNLAYKGLFDILFVAELSRFVAAHIVCR